MKWTSHIVAAGIGGAIGALLALAAPASAQPAVLPCVTPTIPPPPTASSFRPTHIPGYDPLRAMQESTRGRERSGP